MMTKDEVDKYILDNGTCIGIGCPGCYYHKQTNAAAGPCYVLHYHFGDLFSDEAGFDTKMAEYVKVLKKEIVVKAWRLL